jgi:hypothetical protein
MIEVLKLALEHGSFPQGSGIIHNLKKAIKELESQEQWGASAVTHPEYVAEQKRKTEELRFRLTQPEQEPVAIVTGDAWETDIRFLPEGMALPPDTKLYTTPPQRTWVGLEGEEIRNSWEEATKPDRSTMTMVTSFARALEAKLKEKNT